MALKANELASAGEQLQQQRGLEPCRAAEVAWIEAMRKAETVQLQHMLEVLCRKRASNEHGEEGFPR